MKPQTIYLIIGLFIAVIIGMIIFTFFAQRTMDNDLSTLPPGDENPNLTTNPYGIDRIEAKHFYIDGVHTIVGSLMMPTPCDLLEGEAVIAESMPEQISFNFNVINTAEMCAQVMTEQRFMVEASASESASMRAFFMGESVELNLIPAEEGESPEDFELFIKG
ncbi:MAG: hypothetical protein ACK42D_03570 [Candidatus Paceibacteria bacterium]